MKIAVGLSLMALVIAVPTLTHRGTGQNELAEYEVDGKLTVQFRDGNENITSEESEDFTVSVRDGKWFIITKPHSGSNAAGITKYEAGGDGKTFYQVAYYDKKILVPNTANTAIGLIENDAVPENIAGNRISELWLALASSSYLNHAKNGMIEPVWPLIDPKMRSENWLEKADWKRFQNSPHLPQALDYFNKNIIGVNGPKRFLFSLPFPFEKGFTEASYSVGEFTNIDGLTLPIKFSFKIFYVDPTTTPGKLKTNWNILGEVTNVRSACERTNFIPELTEATYVDDRRFAHAEKPVKALAYMVTNGDWPEKNSQSLQKSYQDELKVRADAIKYGTKPKQSSNHKWIWPSAILIVLTSAVMVGRIKNKRRKK